MRYLFISSVLLLFIFSSCSQLNMETNKKIMELSLKVDSLSSKIEELSAQNKLLEDEFTWIESEIVELTRLKHAKTETPLAAPSPKVTQKATPDWQCQAITNSGKRCSRAALKDSKYCWQHKQTYEPDKPEKKSNPAGSVSPDPVK